MPALTSCMCGNSRVIFRLIGYSCIASCCNTIIIMIWDNCHNNIITKIIINYNNISYVIPVEPLMTMKVWQAFLEDLE